MLKKKEEIFSYNILKISPVWYPIGRWEQCGQVIAFARVGPKGIDFNASKRLSPTPSVSNLNLSTVWVTRSSGRGSVDGFSRECLKRLATFDSLPVQMRLEERSRMESRTIVCCLGEIWRRLELLEWIYGCFLSVDPSGRFAGVPNLGKPYIERKPFTVQPIKRP